MSHVSSPTDQHRNDVSTIVKLLVALGKTVTIRKLKRVEGVAMKVFVDFVDPRWKMTAAYQAANNGSDGALRLLHGRRADLNAPTTDGEIGGRPVHIAAQKGHTGTIQLLANLRADINLRRSDGGIALHDAARNGRVETTTLLIGLKADVNSQCNAGCTPSYDSAASPAADRVIRVLLTAKANVNLASHEGATPLYMMASVVAVTPSRRWWRQKRQLTSRRTAVLVP